MMFSKLNHEDIKEDKSINFENGLINYRLRTTANVIRRIDEGVYEKIAPIDVGYQWHLKEIDMAYVRPFMTVNHMAILKRMVYMHSKFTDENDQFDAELCKEENLLNILKRGISSEIYHQVPFALNQRNEYQHFEETNKLQKAIISKLQNEGTSMEIYYLTEYASKKAAAIFPLPEPVPSPEDLLVHRTSAIPTIEEANELLNENLKTSPYRSDIEKLTPEQMESLVRIILNDLFSLRRCVRNTKLLVYMFRETCCPRFKALFESGKCTMRDEQFPERSEESTSPRNLSYGEYLKIVDESLQEEEERQKKMEDTKPEVNPNPNHRYHLEPLYDYEMRGALLNRFPNYMRYRQHQLQPNYRYLNRGGDINFFINILRSMENMAQLRPPVNLQLPFPELDDEIRPQLQEPSRPIARVRPTRVVRQREAPVVQNDGPSTRLRKRKQADQPAPVRRSKRIRILQK
ncbi:unnamed protein product [Caenorhabditis bovis]|uniref:Uncharacterized protein n=1 Tax=Caenorhabditis bovis TaxID=2654633 RepID=A0A8S1EZL5_9PELO|nr:unnamed protein product [Caenorhabditis bovis]